MAELAARVAELMRAAWRNVETIVSGKSHNKVLAVELLLSQRARGLQPDDSEQWRLHAATSLLSGIAIGNADKTAGTLICHHYRCPELYREYRCWEVPLVFHSYHAGNNAPEKLSSHDRNGATQREADS